MRIGRLALATALAITACTGLASPSPNGSRAAPPPPVRLPGHVPALVSRSMLLGQANPSQSLRLAITLPLRDRAAVDQLLRDQADRTSPRYHRWLTPAQFTARFSPTLDQVERVQHALTTLGLQVTGISANRAIVDVSATVAQAQHAFSVQINTYRAPSGRIFYAPAQGPLVPDDLAQNISGIVGLDSATVFRPLGVMHSGGASYTPSQLRSLYDYTGEDGNGQTVALVEFQGFIQSDINAFDQQFQLPPLTPAVIAVDGGFDPTDPGQEEVELDIEVVHGIAPQARIHVYEAPNDSAGIVDVYNAIASDSQASVVSTSWGDCEINSSSIRDGVDTALSMMALGGQTVFAASGDGGKQDCLGDTFNGLADSPDYPASSPLVTGVGGTSLSADPDTGSYVGETLWDDQYGATGGGYSTAYQRPSWQMHWCTGGAGRCVPDVAADADPNTGYKVWIDGGPVVYGGTSAASPLWAAIIAGGNRQADHLQLGRLGQLNPAIYGFLNHPLTSYGNDFHDIRASTNPPHAYPAGPGYDLATGLGSPDASHLLADLLANPSGFITDTPTGSPTRTDTPTATPTSMVIATSTRTATSTPTGTATSPNYPTVTGTPSASGTPTATDAPTSTATSTSTTAATNTPSSTFTPSDTATPANTSTPTGTGTPTSTRTVTRTTTPTVTSTPLHPILVASPTAVAPGGAVSLTGDHFAATSPISVQLGSSAIASYPQVATTDSSGHFTASIPIPADLVPGALILIIAMDGASHQAQTQVGITGPAPSPTYTSTQSPTITVTATSTATQVPVSTNLIVNGTFANGLNGWTLDGSPTPVLSTSQAHGGATAALLGSLQAPEPQGNSGLYQTVNIPANAIHPTLTFWCYPATTDIVQFDWQEVDIRSAAGAVLTQLQKVASNARAWVPATYDLSQFRGQTVQIYFYVHQDGYGDPTSMYLDDVAIVDTGDAGPTPTATLPPVGRQLVQNPGFENGATSWTLTGQPAPVVVTSGAHGGTAAVLLGSVSPPEPYGNSIAYQDLTIPSGIHNATLNFWYRPGTTDIVQFDWQELDLRDTSGNLLGQLMKTAGNSQAWQFVSANVTAYAGRTVRLYFYVHQDGYGDPTSMLLDDVTLTTG